MVHVNRRTKTNKGRIVKELIIANGVRIKIDLEDYDKVKNLRITLRKGYPSYTVYDRTAKVNRTKKIHRLVMNALPGQEVDHINRDKLDNRKENLRICTRSENNINKGVTSRNKLGVKNVRVKPSGRYSAEIQRDGIYIYLGTFDTIEEASNAVRSWR